MSRFWRLASWITRIPLALACVLFTLIALKYLTAPVASAAADAINLGSIMAISRLRVGFGGFPLALALILLWRLLSSERVLDGLVTLAVTVAVLTGARLLGIAVDGPAEEALRLLRAEIVLLAVSVAGIALERARRRRALRLSTPGARS